MNLPALIRALEEKGLTATDIAEVIEAAQSKPRKRAAGKSARFVPEDWKPTASHVEKAAALGMSQDQFDHAEQSFREWEFKDAKTNFDLAFHRWLRTNAGRPHGTAIVRDFAADRASARVQAMVEGARIASASGRRRWSL